MIDQQPLFLLLDGNALLHRAWHALPPLTTSDGRVVNAAYGFSMIMEKLLAQLKPEYAAVAWDLPGQTFRHQTFAAYKAQREKKEPELYAQIPIIQNILEKYGIKNVSLEGFEADDLIGTLSQKAEDHKIKTLIATGDMDSFQLVSDLTHVLTFQKGVSETKTYDPAAIRERFGLEPKQLIDYKALRGDPSDNIPGVAGIGEKTATELVQKFGSVQKIFQALKNNELPEKYAKKLKGQETTAEIALKLVTVVRQAPLGSLELIDLKKQPPNFEALKKIFHDLQFKSLLKKYETSQAKETVRTPSKKNKKTTASKNCFIGRDEKNTREYLQNLSETKILAMVLQTGPKTLFEEAGLTYAAISNGLECAIIPLPKSTDFENLLQVVRRAETIIIHDLKQFFHLLKKAGVETEAWQKLPWFDLMIGGYLLTSGERDHGLEQIAEHYGQIILPPWPNNAIGKNEREDIAKIVSSLPTVFEAVKKELRTDGLLKLFQETEMPLVPILFQMETVGIALDAPFMKDLSSDFEKELAGLTKKIHRAAGQAFNIQSPLQLAEILFEKMNLPTKGLKKTKTGVSTAAAELEKIYEEHEIIPLIMEFRELAKLQNTYIEALPQLIAPDGRIHTTFNQTITATGRLSSSDPNLQNIPTKTALGRKIRRAFVADKNRVLLSADYSQIELRLMAVVAQEKTWIAAFKKNEDIHLHTASEIWGVPDDQVTKEQRSAAKAINFGLLYGIGPRSLARSTGLTVDEAKKFIDRFFELHPAIKKYLEETKKQAHEIGFVETFFGRRRHLPDINSGVQMLVAAAERMATNMPIQGAGADIIKMAMLQIDGWIKTVNKGEKKKGAASPVKMLLQVHDELVFEVEKNFLKKAAMAIKKLMESVTDFEVPLKVDIEVGKNWGELEKIENLQP